MIYLYDGTIEGLFTVIFNAYKVLEDVDLITKRSGQMNFMADRIKCSTEIDKAKRVRDSIIKNFSYSFYDSVLRVFAANNERKEVAIAKTLKKLYTHGFYYYESADEDLVEFKNLLKRVSGEIHSFKGLLRFEEKDGLLFAKFEPQNDILIFVYKHFKRRLVNEKFVIADIVRNKAVIYNGERGNFFDFEMSEDMKTDDSYIDLWLSFYDAVAIDERKNEKLRMQNMPKKYWKNLPEMNRPKKYD